MTAGGNNNISFLLAKHSFVFPFNDSSAYRSFLHVVEAKLFERISHGLYSNALVIGYKRGSKADDHRIPALKKNAYALRTVYYLLGILGTYDKAMAAQNTFISYNMRLVS